MCPYLKQVAIMFSQPEKAIKLSLSASCDSGKITVDRQQLKTLTGPF